MEIIEIGRERILRLQEHEIFTATGDDCADILATLKASIERTVPTNDMATMQLMNMDYLYREHQFRMDYYIGADWIDRKKDQVLEVLPKIRNIDFQKMLMKCFEHTEASESLDELFFIRAEDKPICLPSQDFQLEPLVIIYYLNLVTAIVKKGLRSDFVGREERLKGRIKGKIMMSRYVKHGVANNRKDLVDCRFEEYDVDCLDNRILKKALLVAETMIENTKTAWGSGMYEKMKGLLRFCMPAFEHVSADVNAREIQHVHVSPMFSGYRSAIKMAKTIIRRQGIGLTQQTDDGNMMVPPFIINMPLLFERYVYALLCDKFSADKIVFQTEVKGNRPDFLKADERLILDTKYITSWEEKVEHDNVRQLSGYARSIGIRNWLGVTDDTTICPCVIIYPNADGLSDFKDCGEKLFEDGSAIPVKGYISFKKISVALPVR